eukprot:2200539-Rhodomonas_salina.1
MSAWLIATGEDVFPNAASNQDTRLFSTLVCFPWSESQMVMLRSSVSRHAAIQWSLLRLMGTRTRVTCLTFWLRTTRLPRSRSRPLISHTFPSLLRRTPAR